MKRNHPGLIAIAIAIAAFLFIFLIGPILTVIYTAFTDGQGNFTFSHFLAFAEISLMRESFANSLYVAGTTVFFATVIAIPLAYLTVRFQFRGAVLIQTLGVLPLVMPAFVGAAAMQLIFGRSGAVNLILMDTFGFSIPIMEGLNGIIFVETLHYFPFILLNLSASLATIDSSMEEAGQNLGASGWRLFRKIIFPLALPGYIAGASLVFIKVFDDLGTPLVLNVTNMLAPQAYLRVTSIGIEDPIGYVICVILVLFSIAAMAGSWWFVKRRDYALVSRGGAQAPKRKLTNWQTAVAYGWIIGVLMLVLSPHLGILLMSFFKVWSFSVLPEQFTLVHYATIFTDAKQMIWNTILYCGLAAFIDIIIGGAIAYIVIRTTIPGRQILDHLVTVALAMPGLVLGIGYLRAFRGIDLPFGMGALTASWVIFVIAYSVRRLPYALRSCMAALTQVHPALEEAAENIGAGRGRIIRKIVIPLMMGGLLAGFVTSFITAAAEISETILLTSRESLAPMSYGIYLYFQSIAGRGPGAALSVVAITIVALGTYISHRLAAAATPHQQVGNRT
ncbi:iron ABC transporter permease [Zwartia sp.]|uniref:ABC transporter permease n=1 Tax=Zwartia sp. TaxID=2978004 RepID=UPI00272327E3|nr:iron ABC transporter permease [Zwartia sp.]MDO9025945.1 iron ABC transporter permease [Zwartia sp.]